MWYNFVVPYDVVSPRWRDQFDSCFEFRDRTYAFYGVWADDYAEQMRSRSQSWKTVTFPSADYCRLKQPIAEFL